MKRYNGNQLNSFVDSDRYNRYRQFVSVSHTQNIELNCVDYYYYIKVLLTYKWKLFAFGSIDNTINGDIQRIKPNKTVTAIWDSIIITYYYFEPFDRLLPFKM